MKKIAMLSDTHFGIRKNNKVYLESQMRFFREQFIPELKAAGVKTIFILGDLFHSRTSVEISIFHEVFNLFLNDLAEFDIAILTGNHDLYYADTTEVTSLDMISSLSNVSIIDEFTMHDVDLDTKLAFFPWITDSDKFKQDIKTLKKNPAKYIFGHFDIIGCSMNSKVKSMVGFKPTIFKGTCEQLFTGHYHTPSDKKSGGVGIKYLGSPYQTDRTDLDLARGYYILDIDDDTVEFVENTKSMKHITVEYPDTIPDDSENYITTLVIDSDKVEKKRDLYKYLDAVSAQTHLVVPHIKYISSALKADVEDMQVDSMTEMKDVIVEYAKTVDGIDDKKDAVINKLNETYDKVLG